jgi:hypothetical protein
VRQTSLDKLQAEVAQQSTGMLGRMQLARALASAGKVDEATDAYVWLWEHMLEHEPAMFGVRASFMLAEIGDLCSRHASARAKFAALRDAALPRSQEALDSDSDPLMDWMLLNQALGEQERTLEWFGQSSFNGARVRCDHLAAVSKSHVLTCTGASRWTTCATPSPASDRKIRLRLLTGC